MAQAHSPVLETAWAALARTLHAHVAVQWNKVDWTDETDRVLELTIEASLYDPSLGLPGLGQGQPGQATLTLSNEDNRYSPDNAASPLHASIAGGIYRVPIRIDLSYACTPAEEPLRQFTGQIECAREWQQPGAKLIQLQCLDMAEPILQHKVSTPMATNQRPDQFIDTLLHAVSPVPPHSLDQGLSIIPWCWADDENVWAECQAIAEADGGMFYASKDGTLVYERMTHWLEGADHTAARATLNTGNAWWLEDNLNWRNCYTEVIVEYAPRYVGGETRVYQALDMIEVAPGKSKVETARYRSPALDAILPAAPKDYHAISTGGQKMTGSLTIYLSDENGQSTKYAQRADLRFVNAHPSQSIYILGLQMRGTPVTGDEAQEVKLKTSLSAIPGSKTYPLRGNPYLQTEFQARRLCEFLRDRLERPRRLLAWHGPACPWLEMGDRVRIQDADAGIDADAYILTLNQTAKVANGMWEEEIVAIPAANLFPQSSYFVLGTSSWADPSAPIFY